MNDEVKNKLKSRKFWVTMVAAVLVLFANKLGLDVNWEQIFGLVMTVTGYNVGQGIADKGK